MLCLEEKEMDAWQGKQQTLPVLGPKAKGPRLGSNMFLELKGEGVVLFSLPWVSLPTRTAWGGEENTGVQFHGPEMEAEPMCGED